MNDVWLNDPRRRKSATIILRNLADEIDAAPAGSTIRGASYSCAHPIVLKALERARRRGVVVLLCLDGRNRHFPSARRFAKGAQRSNRPHRSRVVFTKGSARGRRGVTHSKFWLFSHNQTVILGSSNVTRTSAFLQWSSMEYLPEHDRLYDWLDELHAVMMEDRVQRSTGLEARFGDIEVRTCPRPHATDATDPVMAMLDRVEAAHARSGRPGAPLDGLRIRVAQHGFNGRRAIWVALRLAALARRGAYVQVICGIGTGKKIPGILRAGGVKVRRGRRGLRHIHWKFYGASWLDEHGRRNWMVSDGSENCSDQSLLRNDEVQVELWGHGHVAQKWWKCYDTVWDWSAAV